MKVITVILITLFLAGFAYSTAVATHHTPEERGKTLFNDDYFASGQVACSSCHPNGSGLEKAGDRKDLANQVNLCIVNANKGKAIDVNSAEMQDIIAYIKSLKK